MKLVDLYEAQKLGDCYEATAKYIIDNSLFGNKDNLILVHAEVTGQGDIEGVKYGHAWVEDGNTVIDVSNGRNIKMDKKMYYALGNVNSKKMYRYSMSEVRKKLVDSGIYGPWDLKTDR